jgi:uncharacterized membrane protein
MRARCLIAVTVVALGGCGIDVAAVDRTPTAPPPSFTKAAGAITLVSLAPPPSVAKSVSDAGVVAITGGGPFDTLHAFVWTPATPRGTTGTLADIGTLGGTGASAVGMNNSGWVVGGSADASAVTRPFVWTTTGGMKAFGVPVDITSAMDANDARQVVGLAGTSSVRWRAVIASDGSVEVGELEALPVLPGAVSSAVFAINQLGQAAGWSVVETNHAVLWTRTSTDWIVEDLGKPAGANLSVAMDVNDAGLVVGYSNPVQGCPTALVWTTTAGRKTGMRVLPTLGGCGAEAYGVNNDGDVVGRAATSRGYWRPALWTVGPDGTASAVKDLGSPTPNVSGNGYHVSVRIAGVAQVAGFLSATSGGTQATLWTVR